MFDYSDLLPDPSITYPTPLSAEPATPVSGNYVIDMLNEIHRNSHNSNIDATSRNDAEKKLQNFYDMLIAAGWRCELHTLREFHHTTATCATGLASLICTKNIPFGLTPDRRLIAYPRSTKSAPRA